jgi:hypothetical protein
VVHGVLKQHIKDVTLLIEKANTNYEMNVVDVTEYVNHQQALEVPCDGRDFMATPLNGKEYVLLFCDTETTGQSKTVSVLYNLNYKDQVIQLAAFEPTSRKSFEEYCLPPAHVLISAKATQIHGMVLS